MAKDNRRIEQIRAAIAKAGDNGLTMPDLLKKIKYDKTYKGPIYRLLGDLTEHGYIEKREGGEGEKAKYFILEKGKKPVPARGVKSDGDDADAGSSDGGAEAPAEETAPTA